RQEVIKDVETQKGTGLLPFQGMDRASQLGALASPGKFCPFQHDRGEKTGVCKHWLRGLCKGDPRKFLQQCGLPRTPECLLGFSGDCSSNECPFLHVKPALKSRDCPWYDQGFCKDGEVLCKYHHVSRIMCLNYLVGFCPKGPKCQFTRELKLLPGSKI
uniref:Cleavage and polyadenylation specificity factor subunit 4 n=1 Tax=Saimiri boliviensis boliviensis TaxID=39432 RepID=A0A2K6UUG9_SAIBB